MSEQSNPKNQKPIIGISIGDLNGVGPEVIIKTLNDHRLLRYMTPVIYCSSQVISFYKKLLDCNNFQYTQIDGIEKIHHKKVNVINVWDHKIELTPGVPTRELAKYTRASLEKVVFDLKEGNLHAIVTAPLDKELTQDDSFQFPGHTEYLSKMFDKKDNLMFMVSETLRIGVVTGHIPLKDISESITKELIEVKLHIMLRSLINDFGISKPRIAVLGLNPHAGDKGLLGKEEEETISPVIKTFKDKGNLVFGPFSSDGFFGSKQSKQYDGILAMYHDQGLIPFKQVTFGEGVNYTAGIPVIRTSPDHGTGFEIAGKDLADPSSMRNALFLAAELAKNRI